MRKIDHFIAESISRKVMVTYSGSFVKGKLDCAGGTISTPDWSFQGDFKSHKRNGKGRFTDLVSGMTI